MVLLPLSGVPPMHFGKIPQRQTSVVTLLWHKNWWLCSLQVLDSHHIVSHHICHVWVPLTGLLCSCESVFCSNEKERELVLTIVDKDFAGET